MIDRDLLLRATAELIAAPSENPPDDTRAAAMVAARLLSAIPGVVVTEHTKEEPIRNVVAVRRGARPGKRLVLSGHLDTYPAGDASRWSVPPFAATIRGDRLYGRGSADMKGGIAAAITALAALAQEPDFAGEVVLALAGDEESMGTSGTQFLLDTVPMVRGDVAIVPDAGSPAVIRFGEKGMVWLDLVAEGKAAHGAHVHRGENAAERLMEALQRLLALRDWPVEIPPPIRAAIAAAQPVSEPLGGVGEAETLTHVTVNLGMVSAGISPNLVPDRAIAGLDVRLPPGTNTTAIIAAARAAIADLPGVGMTVRVAWEPTVTDPTHPLFTALRRAATPVLGSEPVLNMRVGASDARLFRLAGIPTAVFGPTPHGMGGGDEYVLIPELIAVAQALEAAARDILVG
ncbi:M20/M25/M40 family metallo-hydrolase [Elioraea tepidiphila]|jgi:acetylornithine deacetylase/succinyl-diaminopimelate desuccinylase-like protein|uniref:M20/M25/M40 family metallo-hydrolase n=1 Tax=Elioraea tepidiphila TaxID=457934 RepID=UPI002FDB3AB1